MTQASLFDASEDASDAEGFASAEALADGAWLLRRAAIGQDAALRAAIDAVIAAAPWRHLVTPGGWTMSVAMSNCGPLGWVSDRRGYRYEATDPSTGRTWPPMPAVLRELAQRLAERAGYPGFTPDACLVNQYAPGTRLSLHQDRDERDYSAPIVSVSLGLSAVFLFGGLERAERPRRIALAHGDVVVWGGASRLAFHGIAPLKDGEHPFWGPRRINLTFRQAG